MIDNRTSFNTLVKNVADLKGWRRTASGGIAIRFDEVEKQNTPENEVLNAFHQLQERSVLLPTNSRGKDIHAIIMQFSASLATKEEKERGVMPPAFYAQGNTLKNAIENNPDYKANLQRASLGRF